MELELRATVRDWIVSHISLKINAVIVFQKAHKKFNGCRMMTSGSKIAFFVRSLHGLFTCNHSLQKHATKTKSTHDVNTHRPCTLPTDSSRLGFL